MTIVHQRRKPGQSCESVGIQYNCDNCMGSVTKVVRIQCAECEDIDVCVECFIDGVEIGQHKSNHSYRVVEPYSFPIYEDGWRADEEILLIEGIQSLGLGNWQDISEYISTKSAYECEDHYCRLYIDSDSFPLVGSKYDIKEKRLLDLSVDMVKPQNPIEVLSSHPANQEVSGYMPLRGEFEVEYENDAELLIKDLEFSETDLDMDVEFKLSALIAYNHVLDKREYRKRLIFEYELVNFKRISQIEKNYRKEEREVFHRTQKFARFMSKQDYQTFSNGLVREIVLNNKINYLRSLLEDQTKEDV